jgi:cell division septation protein DedD
MRNDGESGRPARSALWLAGATLTLFVVSSTLGMVAARWFYPGAPAVNPLGPTRPSASPRRIARDDAPAGAEDRLASANRDEAPEPLPARPVGACAVAWADNPKGDYVVQVASHAASAPADQHRRRLRAAGVMASVARADVAGRGTVYRVLVGPFVSRRAAEDCLRDLGAEAGVGAWVHREEHLPSPRAPEVIAPSFHASSNGKAL